jgi:hypothetical protein
LNFRARRIETTASFNDPELPETAGDEKAKLAKVSLLGH